jgi:hypothetical protein
MSNHIFRDVDRHVTATVMHGNRVTYHLGENRAGATLVAKEFLITVLVHSLDFLKQFRLNERAFFQRS